jgi:hypothetical protein
MVINFAVKESGLEAQLLSAVVKHEKPELDKQRNDLVVKVKQPHILPSLPCLPPAGCRALLLLMGCLERTSGLRVCLN